MPICEGSPHKFRERGRPNYIDWAAVADGSVWRFVKGDDFEGESKRIQVSAHSAARRRGMVAETETQPNGDVLIKFSPRASK